MNESLVRYLAGLLDADGSLSFECHRGYDENIRVSLKLHLASSDAVDHHGLVASLPTLTGMGHFNRYHDKYNQWFVGHRNELEMLLPRLIKHQVIKARHWQWLLDYWREYRSQAKGQKFLTANEWALLQEQSKVSRRNVGPIKPKNHPSCPWLAGFLDGDGCFSFGASKDRHIRLSVTEHAMDLPALEFLQKAFGGTIKSNSRGDHLKVWWRGLGPRDASFALNFLPKLVKHSRIKKHKIEQMIHFHTHRQRLSVRTLKGEATV
jgi:hypothetical protein